MKKENRLIKYLESLETKGEVDDFFNPIVLGPEILENEEVQKFLLTLDEFKGVKKINILKAPMYLGDAETGIPTELLDDYIGQTSKTKSFTVPTRAYDPEKEEGFKFPEEIDLYTISLSPRVYDPKKTSAENLGPGVWIMPTLYSPNNFEPYKEIKIVFSPEKIQDVIANKEDKSLEEEIKNRIIKNVEKAFNEGLKENVPYKRVVLFRASDRSFKKNEQDVATE